VKTITLRDVPPALAAKIEERARRTRGSLNRTVIEMLSERTADRGPTAHHDLDHLAGAWSDDEADRMDEAIAAQRWIDAEQRA